MTLRRRIVRLLYRVAARLDNDAIAISVLQSRPPRQQWAARCTIINPLGDEVELSAITAVDSRDLESHFGHVADRLERLSSEVPATPGATWP